MDEATSGECVHFESTLRKHHESLHVGFISMDRLASGQWKCCCSGSDFLVSLRTEVLADDVEASDFLFGLKQEARRVRSTLLQDNAHWMKCLGRNQSNKTTFLRECWAARSQSQETHGAHICDDDEDCEWCGCSKKSAQLAGRHHCKVTAQFCCSECSSKWSSVLARFDPREERVLGQKCKSCEVHGVLEKWRFSEAAIDPKPGSERKPHRSDLCEACYRFGNCQGAFFEPFIMSSAIEMTTRQHKTQWYRSGNALVAEAGNRFHVAMLPHVVCAESTGRESVHNAWSQHGRGRGFGKGFGKGGSKHKGGRK